MPDPVRRRAASHSADLAARRAESPSVYAAHGPLIASARRLAAIADLLREYAWQLQCEAADLQRIDSSLRRRVDERWWETLHPRREGDKQDERS